MVNPTSHIGMLPWFALGHQTPFLHLSNKLAERGHRISLFLPSKTQSKLNHLNLHPNLITFIPIVVPQVEGLPAEAETMGDVPLEKGPLLLNAFDLTQPQVETALQNLKPDAVLFDFAYWIPKIGHRQGFKTIFYYVVGASAFASVFVPAFHFPIDRPFTESVLMQPPPGYPYSSSLQFRLFEARTGLVISEVVGNTGLTRVQVRTMSINECDAIAFRSCREIEGPFFDYIESQYQYKKKVLLTGHILPDLPISGLDGRWESWLGEFKKGSVVYCAFGSECILQKNQFQELVIGLELTGLPFMVVLKPPYGAETVEEALPDGFKERVKGRGVVHGGWVQQQLILKHPSVGCFVSHCGFGSMWESLMSDCQIVLVPNFWDQFLNAKLLSKELKVAVEVERREEDGWFSREDICKAVNLVMHEGSQVGDEVRLNHDKLKKSLLREGFESSYMDEFNKKLDEMLY